MADQPFDVRTDGDAQRIGAEALGEPGQRRFRILAIIDGETHIVWMEKQQVQALGLALEQVLEQLADEGPELSEPNAPLQFDPNTRSQFRAGRMELGFDEQRDRLVIIAHDVEDESDTPRFTCRISREQAREFSAEAAAVVAAGRPRCPLCGASMDPGHHACPQQNGHFPLHAEPDDAADTPAG
ncbi:MAG: DUF3090 family protein [Thermomicrobiales bacterium]